jgi:hypothetical protein
MLILTDFHSRKRVKVKFNFHLTLHYVQGSGICLIEYSICPTQNGGYLYMT